MSLRADAFEKFDMARIGGRMRGVIWSFKGRILRFYYGKYMKNDKRRKTDKCHVPMFLLLAFFHLRFRLGSSACDLLQEIK